MLTDDVWERVVDFYDLHDHQLKAEYANMMSGDNFRFDDRSMHTFICVDCMARALGHMPGEGEINDSPFNAGYIRRHIDPSFVSDRPDLEDAFDR